MTLSQSVSSKVKVHRRNKKGHSVENLNGRRIVAAIWKLRFNTIRNNSLQYDKCNELTKLTSFLD